MFSSFSFAKIPQILFGLNSLHKLYDLIQFYGKNILILTGASSLDKSGKWGEIATNLDDLNLNFEKISISSEPSPSMIDNYALKYESKNVDLIISIGGGSVIDAGKAVSAMIPKKEGIKNYLEGIGTKTHDGEKIPFIAIPTTSGTGSEATKNAVISDIGPNGFKKSLRHDNLIPDIAIIDPILMITCPPSITAACGLDAFTQLLEAYTSSRSSPMTDALAYSGLKQIKDNLIAAYSNGASDVKIRSGMAYGSLISGITLANAGLGVIHGLASSIGGYFEVPHGVVCGTLLSEATKMNINKLEEEGSMGNERLRKYAQVGALIKREESFKEERTNKYCTILIDTLDEWIQQLKIDKLSKYGIVTEDVNKIVAKVGLKNNPVRLSDEEIKTIIINRL
ncbi:MAG: iron-containing alcohol dehydrogenase [Promethearchaeota archaeon]|jgi:alcohol dehydrogenase class IV